MRSLRLSVLTAAVFLTAGLLGREMSPWQSEPTDLRPPLSPWKGEGAVQWQGEGAIDTCFAHFGDIPEALRSGGPVDASRVIVVYKRQRKLGLYEHGALALCVSVELGDWPYEAKVQTDGESTPEGWYTVSVKRTNNPDDEFPKTVFTEALHVSYPNGSDVDRALARGVITPSVAAELRVQISLGLLPEQETGMGGAILIHDWAPGVTTAGCVGLEGADMHTLFVQTEAGDPILILPWQTVLYADGTTSQDVIPERPPPNVMPDEMIDRANSRPGHTVLKAIEITAE